MKTSSVLLDRFINALRFFCSPVDGSALEFDEADFVIRDKGGNEFPVEEGIPILIPDPRGRLSRHFELASRFSAPSWVLGNGPNSTKEAAELRQGFILGFRVDVRSLRMIQNNRLEAGLRQPGTIYEDDDHRPVLATKAGIFQLEEYSVTSPFDVVSDWESFKRMVGVLPPYFLNENQYPDVEISSLFEILNFPLKRSDLAGDLSGSAPQLVAADPVRVMNVSFLRSLFDVHSVDVRTLPVLDIGCGNSSLVGAFEDSGAWYPVGTDIRSRDFERFMQYERAIPAGADMFHWCYAPNTYGFVSIRNNSAFCKAGSLDDRFKRFGTNLLKCLHPRGIAHLSLLTDFSRQCQSGFTNITLEEFLEYFASVECGLVKLMKLGTYTAFLLCRKEDLSYHQSARREFDLAQRAKAYKEYRATSSPDQRILTNFFLAVADFVSEIALRFHRSGKSVLLLEGQGILGYYCWRMLELFYHNLPFRGYVLDASVERKPSAFNVLSPEETLTGTLADSFRVLVDTRHYDGVARSSRLEAVDALFFELEHDNALRKPLEPDPPFHFHFASGDHDLRVPPVICNVYFRGQLHRLGNPSAPSTKCEDFEQTFAHDFPLGYLG